MTNFILPILVGFIAFFVVWVLMSLLEDVTGKDYDIEAKEEEVESPLLKMILPIGKFVARMIRPFFRELEQTIFFQEKRSFRISEYGYRFTGWWKERVQKLLIGSGKMDHFDPLEIIGLQIVGAIFGTSIGLFFYSELSMSMLIYGGTLMGFFFPIIALADRAGKRQTEIRIMLPYTLDLLTLSVEAGIDFTQALQRIVERGTSNALMEELSRMIQQIQIGKPRPAALRELASRVDIEEVKSIVQSLIQADELGSSLGPVLRIQAEQLRVKRSQRAEKLAQQAPVKMLLPLIGCIFPTVFIVLFGPMAIQVIRQFYGGK